MAVIQKSTGNGAPKQGLSAPASRRLGLSRVRAVFRLLAEMRDRGAAPLVWRRHMLAGLLKLVSASTAAAAEALLPRPDGGGRVLGAVILGVNDTRLLSVYRALIERGGCLLDLHRDALGERANATVTRTRQQMAENRAWRRRSDLDPWRALDCEYFICSGRRIPASGCVHLIILTRSTRERPFDERDRRTVALLHSELHRLWRRADDAGPDLPPRLQRTLELLLEGLSEGEIVARLDLSPHTVHDHVKRLYRCFQVNSRAQLLTHVSHLSFGRAPRLCVDLLEDEADERPDLAATAARPSGAAPARAQPPAGPRAPQR